MQWRPAELALLFGLLAPLAGCSRLLGPSLEDDLSGRIRAAIPGAAVRAVDVSTLEVSLPRNQKLVVNLGNVEAACAAAPGACESAKASTVAAIRETLRAGDAPPDPAELRATVRARQWLEAATAATTAGAAPMSRPFAADMVIVYVFDAPTSMRAVSPEDLALLHMDASSLHARAVGNLDRALAVGAVMPVVPGSRVMSLVAGDSYEASRLLMATRCAALARTVEGELVASVPRRDQVLVTGGAHPEDVAELRRRTGEIFAGADHAVSRAVLRRTPSGWVELTP